MPKQTEERKQLKKELTRVFQKAAQPQMDSVGVPRTRQWGLSRKVVNAAEKSAKSGTDASLKKSFKKFMKVELASLAKAVATLQEEALINAISAQQTFAPADFTPRPQPPSININSGPPRFTY